jgi:hypothetical protein
VRSSPINVSPPSLSVALSLSSPIELWGFFEPLEVL